MFSPIPDRTFPHEFDDPRPRVRACWWAFSLATIALGIQSAECALQLYVTFSRNEWARQLERVMVGSSWNWIVGTPLTWGAALASYLLLRGSLDPAWRWRAGLLAAMNTFDLLLWATDHARELGLGPQLQILRSGSIAHGLHLLQRFELWLFASLGARAAHGVGRTDPVRMAQAAHSTVLVGAGVWILAFGSILSIQLGWVRPNPARGAEYFLMHSFGRAMLTITAFQTTIVCATTARALRQKLVDWWRAEDEHELLQPKQDQFDDRGRGDPWEK